MSPCGAGLHLDITNRRTRKDLITVVSKIHENIDSISALSAPTIIDKEWLRELKMAGVDKSE